MNLNKLYDALVKLDEIINLLKEAGEFAETVCDLENTYDSLNNILDEAKDMADDVKSEMYTDDDCIEDVLEDESLSNVPFDNRGDYND